MIRRLFVLKRRRISFKVPCDFACIRWIGEPVWYTISKSSREAVGCIHSPTRLIPGTVSSDMKRLGREADDAPPCSAGVKSEWSCTSNPACTYMACTATALPLFYVICRHLVRCIKVCAALADPVLVTFPKTVLICKHCFKTMFVGVFSSHFYSRRSPLLVYSYISVQANLGSYLRVCMMKTKSFLSVWTIKC